MHFSSMCRKGNKKRVGFSIGKSELKKILGIVVPKFRGSRLVRDIYQVRDWSGHIFLRTKLVRDHCGSHTNIQRGNFRYVASLSSSKHFFP
jgi:hypothetical protein